MKNIYPVIKRVYAYLIDIILVMLLSFAISKIPFLEKDNDKYQEKYSQYEEKYNELKDLYELLETSYEDNKIDEEEYNKLIEDKNYQEIIISSYEDKKISQGEYKELKEKLIEDNDKLKEKYNYILGKISISESIITLVVTLLYFGILQYYLKGQTIGKKILKLKVVSASEKPITILNYILRSLIVNNLLLNLVGIIFLLTTSLSTYTNINNVLSTLVSIIEAVIIFLVLTREDQKGLHDLLFNTKVITIKQDLKTSQSNKDKKVIDIDYEKESDNNEKRKSNKKKK